MPEFDFETLHKRASKLELIRDVETLEPTLRGNPFLDVSPSLLMALNSQRQIVYASEAVLSFLGMEGQESVIGLRPGEAFRCVNCKDSPFGCGSGENCKSCGAVLSIIECLDNNRKSVGECRIFRNASGKGACLDLRVSASPLTIDGRKYVLFCASDVGDERRRNYLEGAFLHEIRNSAGNVLSLGGLLKDECQGSAGEVATMLYQAAERLLGEIDGHRMLIGAETGALKLSQVNFSSVQLLQRLAMEFSGDVFAEGRKIELTKDSEDIAVYGDSAALARVLGNLMRNALEATPKGGLIRAGCNLSPDKRGAVFKIWNKNAIENTAQAQIFRKSFPNKTSKGIGTYMARLVTERYLGGVIDFASSSEEGTVFRVEVPLDGAPEKKTEEEASAK